VTRLVRSERHHNPARFGKRELRSMLEGPDRRSIGRANEAAQAITDGYCDHRHAIALLYDEDALIRMRAADALEKATVQDASAITPFRKQLVDLLCQTEQKEMRWHLAQMVPRLPLDARERRIAVTALERYLEDSSSIVRTCALEALSRLAARNSTLQTRVQKLLRAAERNGTPAMRARARRMLGKQK
jgi:HEAT repeat protein